MGIKARIAAGVLAAGLALVAGYEGTGPTKATPSGPVYVAYKDPIGIPTICNGHTKDVRLGQIATADQCKQWLIEDLDIASTAVSKAVKVDLTDYQHMALSSFVYNVGAGNFSKSTMLKLINQGKFCAAADEFPRWNKAGGEVLPGLTKRRASERLMFKVDYSCP